MGSINWEIKIKVWGGRDRDRHPGRLRGALAPQIAKVTRSLTASTPGFLGGKQEFYFFHQGDKPTCLAFLVPWCLSVHTGPCAFYKFSWRSFIHANLEVWKDKVRTKPPSRWGRNENKDNIILEWTFLSLLFKLFFFLMQNQKIASRVKINSEWFSAS